MHRYADDSYYRGGEWVLLAIWLGWYYVETGEQARARELLAWVEAQADDRGNSRRSQNTRHTNPFRYSDSGKVSKIGWSEACESLSMI